MDGTDPRRSVPFLLSCGGRTTDDLKGGRPLTTGEGSNKDAKRRGRQATGKSRTGVGTRSPLAFVREVLRERPYEKQVEILNAVPGSRRVSVVGCNGSGKDWVAARIVLWWLHAHSPAKVIVTGPTARQVDDIVWNEMRSAYANAKGKIEGRMFRTSRFEVDDQSFALGFATNSP